LNNFTARVTLSEILVLGHKPNGFGIGQSSYGGGGRIIGSVWRPVVMPVMFGTVQSGAWIFE